MAAVTKFNESWNVGNYAGTSNNAYTFRLEVIQNSQSVANNTSNITVNKYLKGINGWSWYQYHSTDAFSGSVTDSIDFFPQSMVVGTEYLIHTYTTNVTHNSEGALALSITNTFTPTGKYSSMPKANTKTISVALDTIARASNISLSSSSININNTSGSVSYTITPYSSSFTHTLVWTLGSGGATITNAQSGSISYSAMLNALSSATSGTLTLTLTTLSNGTAIGSKTATASVTVSGSSVSPSVSLSNIGVAETKISGYLIAGYSRASINSTTTNSSGSTGVTTTFTAENAVLRTTSTTSTSQITVQTDALPRSTINYPLKITATATDSRGNTASANKTANVYGYSAPTVSLQAYRVGSSTSTDRDDSGAWVYVTFSGALGASVNNQNSIQSVTCTYSGAISGTVPNTNTYSGSGHYALADSQTVTFTCTATDKVTSSSLSVSVSGATYSLDLYDNKNGIVGAGFGAIAEPGYAKLGPSLFAKGNWYLTNSGAVSNLNQITEGVTPFNVNTSNRPCDYGVCYTYGYNGGTTSSTWYSQVAFGTNGIIYFRNSINSLGANWGSWQPFYGGFNPPSASTATQLYYGTCSTAAATAAKTASITGFPTTIFAGMKVVIKFTYANGVANPTLSINSGSAIAIKRYGTTAPSTSADTSWNAGSTVQMTYDGTNWIIDNWLNRTYSVISQTNIEATAGTSSGLITGQRFKQGYDANHTITELYKSDTGLSGTQSATWTYSADYRFYIVVGATGSSGGNSQLSQVIPSAYMTTNTNAKSWQFADEQYYVSYRVYYSGTTGTIKRIGGTGNIFALYGVK